MSDDIDLKAEMFEAELWDLIREYKVNQSLSKDAIIVILEMQGQQLKDTKP